MSNNIARSASIISGTTTVAGKVIDRLGRIVGTVAYVDNGKPAPKPAPVAKAEAADAVVATLAAVATAPLTTAARKERKPGGGGGKSYTDIKGNNKMSGDKTGKDAWNTGTSKKCRRKRANRRRFSSMFTANRQDRITRTNHSGFNGRYVRTGVACEGEPLLTPMVLNIVDYPAIVPFVETAEERTASAAHKAARSAYKAGRRRINRANFSLDAVIQLITAPRKGTASKAGGVGTFAYTNVALVAAVADVLVAIATTVGSVNLTRARRRVRKSMNVNQTIARVARKKRQRRASTLRRRNLKPQVKSGYEKQLAKAQRRAAAKRLAAAIAAEKAAKKKVITRYALCAERRAGNNAIYLANGTVAPIMREQKEYHNQVAAQEEAARPLAEQNRRRAAMGLPLIGNDKKVDKTVYLATKAEEKRAQAAYEAGTAIMADILNGSECQPVAVPAEFMALAEARCATSAEGVPEATMSFERSRTPRPKPKSKYAKKTTPTVSPSIKTAASLWKKIDAKDLALQRKLDSYVKRYRALQKSEAKYESIVGYLGKAHKAGLIDCSAYISKELHEEIQKSKQSGVEYSDLAKELDITELEVLLNYSSPSDTPETAGKQTAKIEKSKEASEKALEMKKHHQAVIELWTRILETEEPIEDMLCDLAEAYRKTTKGEAKDSTVASYLLEVYRAGHFDPAALVTPETASKVKELLDNGSKWADVASDLKLTTLEVGLAVHLNKEKPMKHRPKQRTSRQTVDIKVKAPLRISKLGAELGVIPVCILSHVNAEPVKDTDPRYVVLSRQGTDEACNGNAHFNPVPKGKAYLESAFKAANRSENKYVPLSHPLGFDSKLAEGWSASPVGVTPARLYVPIQNRKNVTSHFRDAAFCNVEGLFFTENISHNISFMSLVDGEHDLNDKADGSAEAGANASTVRSIIRTAMRTGNTRRVSALEKHGQTLQVFNALNDLQEQYGGIGDLEDQFYLLLIGRPAVIYDELRPDEDGVLSQGQYRPYCDVLEVYYVPADKVADLVNFEVARTDNNYFTFVELSEEESEEDSKEESTTKVSGRRRGKKVAPSNTATTTVEKTPSEEVKSVDLKTYKEELEAVYHALNHPTSGNRSDNFYSVDEVVDSMLGKEEEVFKELFPGQEPPTGCTAAQKAAYAAAYYLRGFCTERNEYPASTVELPLFDYDWTLSEVEGVVSIIQEMMLVAGKKTKKTKNRKAGDVKAALDFCEVDGMKALKIDGIAAFFFDTDGTVYDWRGRAFNSCLVVNGRKKTKEEREALDSTGDYDVSIKLVTSIGMFVYFLWLVYLPILANWKGSAGIFSNTLENVKGCLQKLGNIFKMTTDRVLDQNGAAHHLLVNTFSTLMFEERSPMSPTGKWVTLEGKAAKVLAERYGGKEIELDDEFVMAEVEPAFDDSIELSEVMQTVMEMAHEQYGLDFHHTKGQFVAGALGHVNLEVVKKYAPNLFKKISENLGSEVDATKVITNSLKATKLLKRVSLWMAQAESVKNEMPSAAKLYGQKYATYGWLNKTGYAPSHVNLPGMSVFLGEEKDKPEANPLSRISVIRNTFEMVDGSPFDFERTNVPGVIENTWDSVESEDGWTYVTPENTVNLNGSGKEMLFGVNGSIPIYHQHRVEGQLQQFRWKISVGMDNNTEYLTVEYFVERQEFNMKSRSVAKCQYFTATPKILFNELNPDLNPEEITVHGLHLQDALKLDLGYAMCFIIANTAFYNEADNDVVKTLRKMIAEINLQLVGHENLVDGKPVLLMEPAAIAAGLYQKMYTFFDETFGQSRWIHWVQAEGMGQVMHDLYVNKVAAGSLPDTEENKKARDSAWYHVEDYLDYLPELAELGDDLYVVSQDKEIEWGSNVLAFVIKDGKVVEVAQRGVMYLSIPGVQLYNVELFESSTVAEAVTSSVQLLPYIMSLGIVCGEDEQVLAEQRRMVACGKEALYRAKALASFNSGNTLSDNLKEVSIIVDDDGICFGGDDVTAECQDLIIERLGKVGIDADDIDRHQDGLFKMVAEATQDMVFVFDTAEGKISMWLPAMLSFTKLTRKSDDNLDFVSMFFFEVLVPCIEGGSEKKQITLNQVGGVLNSLASSKNARKYFSGDKAIGAKRIGHPSIPVGEVWILETNLVTSPYQLGLREGFPLDRGSVAEGVITSGNRAPMPMGPIERIRLIEEVWEKVEVETENGKETVDVYLGQRRVPFADEVQDETLLAYEISPVQIGVSAMSVNLDGGDDDGDNHFLTLCKHLTLEHITTYETVRKLRSAAIGVDMFSPTCGDYAADHYDIKSYAAASKSLTDLRSALAKKALLPKETFLEYNYLAYTIQHVGVGVMYATYMLGMLGASIIGELEKLDLFSPGGIEGANDFVPVKLDKYRQTQINKLMLVLAEVYEIMLGGFSEGGRSLWEGYLSQIMKGRSLYDSCSKVPEKIKNFQDAEVSKEITGLLSNWEDEFAQSDVGEAYDRLRSSRLDKPRTYTIDLMILNLKNTKVTNKESAKNAATLEDLLQSMRLERQLEDQVEATMKELGANYKLADEFTTALHLLADFYIVKRGKKTPTFGISYVLYTIFQSGRGEFYFGDSKIYTEALGWLDAIKNHPVGAQAVENNVPLMSLSQLNDVLGTELLGEVKVSDIVWSADDLNFFLAGMNSVEESQENHFSVIHNSNTVIEQEEDDEEDSDGGVEPSNDEPDSDDDGGTEEETKVDTEAEESDVVVLEDMPYRELQQMIKELKAEGHEMPKANSKRDVLIEALTAHFSTEQESTVVEEETQEQEIAEEATLEEEESTVYTEEPVVEPEATSDPSDEVASMLLAILNNVPNMPDSLQAAISDLVDSITSPEEEIEKSASNQDVSSDSFVPETEEDTSMGIYFDEDEEEDFSIPISKSTSLSAENKVEQQQTQQEQPEEEDSAEEESDSLGVYTPEEEDETLEADYSAYQDDSDSLGVYTPQEEDDDDIPLSKAASLSASKPADVATSNKEPKQAEPTVTKEPSLKPTVNHKGKKVLPSLKKVRKHAKNKAKKEERKTMLEIKADVARKPEALQKAITAIQTVSKSVDESLYTDKLNTMTARQLDVVAEAVEGNDIMLTGVGGGGKSYSVEITRYILDLLKLPYVVVGSTGTSVMNVGGDGTLNSMFGLKLGFEKSQNKTCSEYEDYVLLKNDVKNSRFFVSAKNYLGKRPIIVIVDEVSMVDNRFLNLIEDAAAEEGVNIQWLLVGDPMQFLPVKGSLFFEPVYIKGTKKTVEYGSFVKRRNFVMINLKHNIRADGDKAWVDCLNLLRMDCLQLDGVKGNLIKDRFEASKLSKASDDAIHIYFNNIGVKRHNSKKTAEMIKNGAEHKTYQARVSGKYQDWHLKKSYDGEKVEYVTVFNPIEEEMTFCVDMPVMIRKNIQDQKGALVAANGSTGVVTKLNKNSIVVCLDSNGNKIELDYAEFEGPKDVSGKATGIFRQIPAHPCFAMTLMKSQGLTINRPGVLHMYYVAKGKVSAIPAQHKAALYVGPSRFPKADLVYFATECEFDSTLTSDQMWKMLVDSYHTSDVALDWMETQFS